MPFPDAKRIIYKNNPLDKVVCQLQFPHILKIDAESPADFQERIRSEFPYFKESQPEYNIQLSSTDRDKISPELLKQNIQMPGNKNYQFSSEDKKWKVNLTRNFIALTTRCYTRWEEFKTKLEGPFNALVELYSPKHFSRIGLRYIDVIHRSLLGLADVSWNELLNQYLLGLLSSPEVSNDIGVFENKYEMNLEDKKSVVRIITRFAETVDTGEVCYVIDSDFHITDKIEINNAMEKMEYFHKCASKLIQWCITNRLRKAMEPREI